VTRNQYKRKLDGKLVGQPAYVTRKPYLLSTLLECAVCSGPVWATKRTGTRAQPRYYYVCTTHRTRGDRLCGNALAAPMERLDAAVLAAMARQVLTPDLVDDVVHRVVELRTAARTHQATARPRLESDLRRTQGELRRYAEAIAISGPLPALLEAIRTREQRRGELEEQIRRHGDSAWADAWQPDELRRKIQARVDDWLGLFTRGQEEQAREMVLRPLLARRIVLTPRVTPAGRFYKFDALLSFDALVTGLIGAGDRRVVTVVPPG